MCISIQHTLKEELKNMQMKSMQILQEQEKKWKETLEQIEVRRTCDQNVFMLCVLCIHRTPLISYTGVYNRRRREKPRITVRASWWA